MKRFMSKKLLVVGVAVAVFLGVGGAAFAFFTSSGTGSGNAYTGTGANLTITQLNSNSQVVYDSLNSPLPPDTWSQAYYATGITEFGNEITPASTSSQLSNVVVALDSQACESGTGATCTTTPGATFPLSITMYLYNAGSPVNSPIATDTQTFNIPFRPSAAAVATPTLCATGNNWSGFPNDGTQWYDAATSNCYYGITYAAVFNTWTGVTLPSNVTYGIYFDASSGPAQSLNVELSNEPNNVTVGSDTDPGNVFVAGTQGDIGPGEITCSTLGAGFAQYSTAAGSGCGLSSPNQDTTVTNIPAVEFNTFSPTSGYIYLQPGGPGQSIDFTVKNNSSSPAYVQAVTVAINTSLLATNYPGCASSWFTIVQPTTPFDVTIPGSTTDTYQPSGGSISMINEPYSQNACENASIPLTFTSN
jgi:hypothetical protein